MRPALTLALVAVGLSACLQMRPQAHCYGPMLAATADTTVLSDTLLHAVRRGIVSFQAPVERCDFVVFVRSGGDRAQLHEQIVAMLPGHPLLRQVAGEPSDTPYLDERNVPCARMPRLITYEDYSTEQLRVWRARIGAVPGVQGEGIGGTASNRNQLNYTVASEANAEWLRQRVRELCIPPDAVDVKIGEAAILPWADGRP